MQSYQQDLGNFHATQELCISSVSQSFEGFQKSPFGKYNCEHDTENELEMDKIEGG